VDTNNNIITKHNKSQTTRDKLELQITKVSTKHWGVINVHVDFKSLGTKLIKSGLPFRSGKITFKEPGIIVFAVTMIECPPKYPLKILIKLMNFGNSQCLRGNKYGRRLYIQEWK